MDTLHEAQQQLAILQNSADAILSALSSTNTQGNAQKNAVLAAQSTLKSFESAIARLQPILDAASKSPPIDALAVARSCDLQKRHLKSISPPDRPSTTLAGLVATLTDNLDHLDLEIKIKKGEGAVDYLEIDFTGFFRAKIAAERSADLSGSEDIPRPLSVGIQSLSSFKSQSPPPLQQQPLLFQRLSSNATEAMFDFCQRSEIEREGLASPLELLLLWLAVTATSMKYTTNSNSSTLLQVDPGNGILTPHVMSPPPRDASWRQLWDLLCPPHTPPDKRLKKSSS